MLTGKGSGPSCITKPSITCVSMCGLTMAFCFFILTGKGSGPSWITNPSITCVSMCGLTMAFCFSITTGLSPFSLSSVVSIFSSSSPDFRESDTWIQCHAKQKEKSVHCHYLDSFNCVLSLLLTWDADSSHAPSLNYFPGYKECFKLLYFYYLCNSDSSSFVLYLM